MSHASPLHDLTAQAGAGKDAARPEAKRRCCAVGNCCQEILAPRSRKDARDTLRAALTCAIEEEIITRNPVTAIRDL